MAIMSITGLDELINNCQRLAGNEIVQNTNKKILRKVGKSVQSTAKNLAPRSANPWKVVVKEVEQGNIWQMLFL